MGDIPLNGFKTVVNEYNEISEEVKKISQNRNIIETINLALSILVPLAASTVILFLSDRGFKQQAGGYSSLINNW